MMIDKRLIRMVPESKKYVAGNVLMQWISLAANVVLMMSITRFFASLYAKNVTGKDFAVFAVIAVMAVTVRFFCAIGASRMGFLSSKKVKKTLREAIYTKLLKLGAAYKEQIRTSEIVQVAVEGVDQLETYFGAYLPQFFYAMLAPLTLFLVLLRECTFCGCIVRLCSADSGGDRSSADLGKEVTVKILGTVYGTWRHLS